jgi:hypothetical protein
MAISKVILNGETQMDVTGKTVTAGSMLSGTTALKNDGTDITGTIASKTSADLTASGATVTAPAGYYASAASKSVASGSAGTPTATKGTVTNHSVSVTPSVTNTTGYITGGTKTGTAVTVSASELVSGTKTISASGTTDVTNYESVSVASGSAKTPNTTITANPTVSVNSSGLITASVSKTQSVTPSVSAGYVSSGTAGTITVSGSGTNQLTTQAAQTIHPSTTDQTIASGKYLTGAQTVKAVTTTNLTAENIVQGVTVKIGDSTDDDCVASVTGTAETGGDDFIITLTKNASTGIWEPDCTFAEAQAAYDGGKNVAFEASLDGLPLPCGEDSRTSYNIKYFVFELVVTSNGAVFNYFDYTWNSYGINAQNPYPYYDTSSATATPADVASGKVFYNADGYQVGISTYSDDLKALITHPSSYTFTFPDDITTIAPYAFFMWDYVNITSIPDSITSIGQNAFGSCRGFKAPNLPSGITRIEPSTFTNCLSLELTSLPSGITYIGSSAFQGDTKLKLSSLPDGVTTIGGSAFSGCDNITISSLPSSLTTLGSSAFQSCELITVSAVPSGVTRIESSVFRGCESIQTITLHDGVNYIGANAFTDCISLTSVYCSGIVTTLTTAAFTSSTNTKPSALRTAQFPNMAISSLSSAFGNTTATHACTVLELVDIGNTSAIAANAFANCNKLQTLILRKTGSICTLSNVSAFLNTPMRGYNSLSGTIYVPSALISTYQTATNWSTIYGEGHVTFAAIEGSQYEL